MLPWRDTKDWQSTIEIVHFVALSKEKNGNGPQSQCFVNSVGVQPTGVGLHEGAMVLMLDRRGDQDDERGLGQGITDSRPVEMRFGVVMEKENLKEKASEKALVIRNWMLNPTRL